MKTYELVAVLEGKATAAKKKSFIEKLEKQVSVLGGKVVNTNEWGVKELAYPIAKNTSGTFIIFTLELDGKGAKDLHNKLRLDDQLIRSLFVEATEPLHIKRSHQVRAEKPTTEVISA